MKRCLLFIFFILVTGAAKAEGTISFRKHVWPIMQQKEFFAKYLDDIFIFGNDAVAIRIGGNVAPHLGGARIGPYQVRVRAKNDESKEAVMVIYTRIDFIDKRGRKTDDMRKAVSVKETFDSIELEEP